MSSEKISFKERKKIILKNFREKILNPTEKNSTPNLIEVEKYSSVLLFIINYYYYQFKTNNLILLF